MDKRIIIAISREYGSGGRRLGLKLSEMLGIPFYDNELINKAAEESGYSKELFEKADKGATNPLMYSISRIGTSTAVNGAPLNDKLFAIQSDVIKDIAQKGSCVIVGRCAQYVLQDDLDCTSVFVYSDVKHRVKRAIEEYNIPEDKVEEIIEEEDKRRATFYNHHTHQKWGISHNYHLAIDTGRVSIDVAAKIVREYVLNQTEVPEN